MNELLGGLFDLFTPYQITLNDLHNASTSLNPSDQIITVDFGQNGNFRFKFDRTEATVSGDQDFKSVTDLLRRTEEWLRSSVAAFSFQTHLFILASYNKLSEGTSQEFLRGFSDIAIPAIGTSEGSGIIFHWNIPEQNWRVQLLIDHSLNVSGGLFIQLLVRSEVRRFIGSSQSLLDLLTETRSHLSAYFPGSKLALRVIIDPGSVDDRQLVLFIITNLAPENALSQLQQFDDHSHSASSRRKSRRKGSTRISLIGRFAR